MRNLIIHSILKMAMIIILKSQLLLHRPLTFLLIKSCCNFFANSSFLMSFDPSANCRHFCLSLKEGSTSSEDDKVVLVWISSSSCLTFLPISLVVCHFSFWREIFFSRDWSRHFLEGSGSSFRRCKKRLTHKG